MSSRGVIASGSEAIQLVVGEGVLAWERRVWHQLDRFTFARDDGEAVVIASGSDAIQLVVQEKAGLPRRFAPRNDGVGTRSLAMTGVVIASGSDAIQLVVGEGLLDWERRVWHQLDRFTFVRDDGTASLRACEAIQLVVQEEAGLPRRFAPRKDGWRLGAFRQPLAGSLRRRSR